MAVLIFGFGSFYLLIRHLPQYEFGVWALFLTITTIIEMSRNGLIQNGLIKLLTSHEASQANQIINASWIVNLVYSVVVFLLLLSASPLLNKVFDSNELGDMFMYYGITILLLIPFSQFNYIQQSKFSFSGIFWSTVIRQSSFFLAVLVIYLSEYQITLVQLVEIQAICTLLGLIIAFFSAKKFLQTAWDWNWAITKKVLQFGKYVMGTNLCSLLYKSMDQLSVGYFLSANFVAIYNAAVRMSNLIEYPSTAIAEVVYPQSAFRTSQGGDSAARSLYEKSVGLTLAITLPVIFLTICFADYIIYFIAGPEYAGAANILRVTMLFGLFTAFTRQFGTVMDSSGRPEVNFRMLLFILIVNIFSNYFFIRYAGVMGAAYGTLLSHVIFFFISQYYLAKVFKVQLSRVFSSMVQYYGFGFSFLGKTLKIKFGVS